MKSLTFLLVTITISIFSILVSFLNYKKDKMVDQNAKNKFAKKTFIIAVIAVLLNVFNSLYNNFVQEEKYLHHTEETRQLKVELENLKSRLYEPTQKEVENEIDEQFSDEFSKKKERALEEYQKGLSAYKNNNFTEAIFHFEKAIKFFRIPAFYMFRGSSYFLTNQLDRAISDYTEAIQLNPNDANAYKNRGTAQEFKGDLAKAIADLSKANQLNRNDANAYNNRETAQDLKGDLEKAIADLNKTIQLNPGSAETSGSMTSDSAKISVSMTPDNTGTTVPEGVLCTKSKGIIGTFNVTDVDGGSTIVTYWYEEGVLQQSHTITLEKGVTTGTDIYERHRFGYHHTITFKVSADGVMSNTASAKIA